MKRLKEIISRWQQRLLERRENELRHFAQEYCNMSDRHCVPCVMVGGVPLYTVTDEKTDLVNFRVNIKDVEHVINSIRIKYVLTYKEGVLS